MKVRITRAGDADLRLGQVIELKTFLELVDAILKQGGEMPIAMLWQK